MKLAVARGHALTAVVRPTSSYQPPRGVEVVKGEVTDPSLLAERVGSADVVISCLGLRRRTIVPWSALLSPPDLVTRVSTIMFSAPGAAALQRFVWISAGGVGDSRANTSRAVRRMIDAGNVGTAYEDLGRAERILSRSSIRSLAVRPVTLVNGSTTGRAGPVRRYGVLSTVRRSDVAQWVLDVADGTHGFVDDRVLLGTLR